MLEKEIEKKLREKTKKLGGRAYKFISPGNNGVPDRLIVLPDGKVGFAELKKPKTGKASKLQERQLEFLKKLGCYVMVIDKVEDIPIFLLGLQMFGGLNNETKIHTT